MNTTSPRNPPSSKGPRRNELTTNETSPREHPQASHAATTTVPHTAAQQEQIPAAADGARRVTVPVDDPFARGPAARARLVLNPGSCSSGLNLSSAGLDSADSLASLLRETPRASPPMTVTMPVDDPFSRGPVVPTRRVLNPGSCSSGLDLLSSAGLDSADSLASLLRETPRASPPMTVTMPVDDHSARGPLAPTRRVLNPGSCSSGLNLLSPSGLDSADSLASLYRETLQVSSGPSAMSVLFGTSPSYVYSVGGARLCPSSSLSRGRGIRNDQGNRGNAEWEIFQ